MRKIDAQSNDADTGGGARDLRFPDRPFRPALERLFPEVGDVKGRPVQRGHLVWEDPAGNRQSQPVEYWPPTDARPGEGRIARIHELQPLQHPPDAEGKAVVLLLVLDDSGELRAFYATAAALRDEWHEDVAQPILECLEQDRKGGIAARGWFNLTDGTKYCHGG